MASVLPALRLSRIQHKKPQKFLQAHLVPVLVEELSSLRFCSSAHCKKKIGKATSGLASLMALMSIDRISVSYTSFFLDFIKLEKKEDKGSLKTKML